MEVQALCYLQVDPFPARFQRPLFLFVVGLALGQRDAPPTKKVGSVVACAWPIPATGYHRLPQGRRQPSFPSLYFVAPVRNSALSYERCDNRGIVRTVRLHL